MPQPAARMGDATVHGGVIAMGFPTVLIGGLPAARMGGHAYLPDGNAGSTARTARWGAYYSGLYDGPDRRTAGSPCRRYGNLCRSS